MDDDSMSSQNLTWFGLLVFELKRAGLEIRHCHSYVQCSKQLE